MMGIKRRLTLAISYGCIGSIAKLPRFIVVPTVGNSDGYFTGAGGHKSLGHMFIPCSTEWNSGEIVFSIDQAVDWQRRAMAAGGAYVHSHTHAHIARRYIIFASTSSTDPSGGPFFNRTAHFNIFLRKVLQIDCRSVVPPGEATECKDCAALL